MAGNKTIFNSTGMECLRDLLIREQGVVFDPNFMSFDRPVCDATSCRTTIHATDLSAQGRSSVYYGSAPYVYKKLSLQNRLPPDLVYSGPYPCTVDQFITTMRLTFDLLFEREDVAVITNAGAIPLTNIESIGHSPDALNRLTFRTLNDSLRWKGGETFRLYLASSDFSSWTPLTLTGDAPNGSSATPYTFRYTAAGGQAPYTYSIVAGSAPAGLNATTGQFEPPVLRTGNLDWTVRVTDNRGVTYDLLDTATISTVPLEITTPQLTQARIGIRSTQQITAVGGALGHRYSLVGTVPTGVRISATGELTVLSDGGTFPLTIRVSDYANASTTRGYILVVGRRSNRELAQALLQKTMFWADFTEADFNDGSVVEAVYARPGVSPTLTVNGTATATDGPQDGAVALVDAYLSGTQNLTQNVGALLFYQANAFQYGAGLAGRGTSMLGWEFYNDPAATDVMTFSCVIDAQRYVVSSPGDRSTTGPDSHMVIGQRHGNQLSILVDGVSVASTTVPDGPLMSTQAVPFTVGRRMSQQTPFNWRSNLDRIVLFRDRIWSDEADYLYNAGRGRRYLDLTADAA